MRPTKTETTASSGVVTATAAPIPVSFKNFVPSSQVSEGLYGVSLFQFFSSHSPISTASTGSPGAVLRPGDDDTTRTIYAMYASRRGLENPRLVLPSNLPNPEYGARGDAVGRASAS